MAIDKSLADEQWFRYVYLRDNGHLDFVEKANTCDANYLGNQWNKADKATLQAQRRPALTINKILPTIDTMVGEQIQQRVDVTFKERRPGLEDLSRQLEMLFRVIHDENQYRWKETEVVEDALITSRGYFDLRLSFRENMRGEAEITVLNPRNVLPDCDAEDYDPDTWNDVIVTKWLSPLDIELLYNKDDADWLRFNDPAQYSQEFDSVYRQFESFRANPQYRSIVPVNREMRRDIRTIDRQFHQLAKVKVFVDMATGEVRDVPEDWDRNKIAYVTDRYHLGVTEVMKKRIRWRITAGPCVLHDDWSPYSHLSVVPYFPHFRRGKTMGAVENLLSAQEYLNKITSQELHVINTTANSGWKVKQGSLRNMSLAELEQRGATTGLVMELGDVNDAEKIEPNQVPTGLDRMSYKAEEYIKSISTVTDNAMGDDREDVSSKAIRAKREVNIVSRARVLDNLDRTRYLLNRNLLDLVQEHYTEPRVYRIVGDEYSEDSQEMTFNQPSENEDSILNDLTLGEYDIVITTSPSKDSLTESEFEQALALKQLGVMIPDTVLIKNSNLKQKGELLRAMEAAQNSPEAQAAAQAKQQAQQLELVRMDSENDQIQADTLLKTANAKARMAEAAMPDTGGPTENPMLEQQRMEHESRMQQDEQAHEAEQKELDRGLEREKMGHEQQKMAQEQDHDVGMARLGHSQAVQEKQVDSAQSEHQAVLGHKIATTQQKEQHKQALALEKAKPKPAKPKAKGGK
jgi:hypothetical protein